MATPQPISCRVHMMPLNLHLLNWQLLTKATAKKHDFAIAVGSLIPSDCITWMLIAFHTRITMFLVALQLCDCWRRVARILNFEKKKKKNLPFLFLVKKAYRDWNRAERVTEETSSLQLNKVAFCLHGPFNWFFFSPSAVLLFLVTYNRNRLPLPAPHTGTLSWDKVYIRASASDWNFASGGTRERKVGRSQWISLQCMQLQ